MKQNDLSVNEKLLLSLMRQLNEQGQEKLIEQAQFFVASERYIKNH